MFPYELDDKPIDRSKWPVGPWDQEPEDSWTGEAEGLRLAAIRAGKSGHWCGYVRVEPGSPLHGKEQSWELDCPPKWLNREVNVQEDIGWMGALRAAFTEPGKVSLGLLLFCHGGLTYAAKGPPGDDGWWFGFDCALAGDAWPRRLVELDDPGVYRTLEYVQDQTIRLAKQIRELEQKMIEQTNTQGIKAALDWLASATGEALAGAIGEYQWEMLVRAKAREAIERLAAATEGSSSYNIIALSASDREVRWTVTAGKNYETCHSSKGEVLGALVSLALYHQHGLQRTKLMRLEPPRPAAAPEAATAAATDDSIPF